MGWVFWRGVRRRLWLVILALLAGGAWGELGPVALASEHHGQVIFNGLPVPGATVTATRGEQMLTVTSDQLGLYRFGDLADGPWTIRVEMLCFVAVQEEVDVAADAPAGRWELKLLPLEQILAKANAVQEEPKAALVGRSVVEGAGGRVAGAPAGDVKARADWAAGAGAAAGAELAKPAEEQGPRPSDGLLINGTINNAATSQYTLAPAFGNSRSSRNLYNGSIGFLVDNSVLDARPYSLTGLDTPKASYNRVTGVVTFGGPLKIPHVLPRGPNVFVAYQWTRDSSDATVSGLVPDVAERMGDLSGLVNAQGQPVMVVNPATGLPFAGLVGPISPQAGALLKLYPLPNIAGNRLYNYQTSVPSATHQDAMQMRMDKTIGRRDQFYGSFALQSSRSSSADLFDFEDKTAVLGLNGNVNWAHRFNRRIYETVGYSLSRLRTRTAPNFAGRENVSGEAGIGGNDQDRADWGPPTLVFSSGIASLGDAQSADNRNETNGVSYSLAWNRTRHNVTVGGDVRRQEFNVLSQQNPRGSFVFTGAATGGTGAAGAAGTVGSDFADFLLGVPDTSSLAFGNADKYLRQTVYDAFVTDDWRVRPELTLNVGVRWEYGAPTTELKGRLVNLDVAPGFAAVAPVLGSAPAGALTGVGYPTSLIRPDKRGLEPRVGLSWRPVPGSTLVVRAGYGIYDDTSIYEASALELAQQAPLSKSLSVQNSASCPLTLADGFRSCAGITADTFAVDPNLRVGYAQTWQLSVQRDLPAALVATATYLGLKGTRGTQEFLPNTVPIGAVNACQGCPAGFIYRASNGDSTREAGQVQVRRRLRSGFTASAQYTYSKSIDDDAMLGGQGGIASGVGSQGQGTVSAAGSSTAVIAQNWLDLRAERGLSTFDQRHLLNVQMQYTTGMGVGGGMLTTGWRGTLLKEWTVVSQINAGSGLPETPVYLAATPGTGVTGAIRPDRTGAAIYAAPAGLHLNPAAYAAPRAGQWGSAGRDSILGPGQFSLIGSLARTFRLKDHYSLDLRVDATNLLNHGVFTAWNTVVNGSTFGLPEAANPMRSLQTTLRVRY